MECGDGLVARFGHGREIFGEFGVEQGEAAELVHEARAHEEGFGVADPARLRPARKGAKSAANAA